MVLVDPTDLFLEHARMMEAREREWSREREQGSIVFEPSEYFLSSEELIETFSEWYSAEYVAEEAVGTGNGTR